MQKGTGREPAWGYIGQFNHYKGVHVLLKAMSILAKDRRLHVNGAMPNGMRGGANDLTALATSSPQEDRLHLWVHGANLETPE